MLTHYIKISYRNLMKHKLQTAACIIGTDMLFHVGSLDAKHSEF